MARETHEVVNQPLPLENLNLYRVDQTLRDAADRFGAGWAVPRLEEYGTMAGGALAEAGRLANRHRPELQTHDRYGHRIDAVSFHPAYHELMTAGIRAGIHALPWLEAQPGAHVARAILEFLHNQADSGTDCPLTMTFACVPALSTTPSLAAAWLPQILSQQYDGSNRFYSEKSGLTIGMAMTEKQGGTDLRANSSWARPLNERSDAGEVHALTGHKWFCSAPMSDAFLTLASLEDGLTCFLLPRWRPDGSRNAVYLQRLKDKLGNWSNASAEIEFDQAFAWLLGEPGRGVATIIQMVALTRFNCMVGSSAIMRHAVIQALHHIQQRRVGGKALIDQPLMRNVIADLILESEAAIWLTLRVAAALDARAREPAAELFVRLVTAVGKYWICKRAPAHVNEAQECLGGLGYIEEHVLPRLYREAPVNSIWEGSGNVQCLDVLRALDRSPETVDALFAELALARGQHGEFDRAADELRAMLGKCAGDAFAARVLTERMAILLQAGLLIRNASPEIAAAFVAARVNPATLAYGGLRSDTAVAALLGRLDVPAAPPGRRAT
jgi:putative acyl-CoA dehydrogenase